jgi:hypothetical protein
MITLSWARVKRRISGWPNETMQKKRAKSFGLFALFDDKIRLLSSYFETASTSIVMLISLPTMDAIGPLAGPTP